LFHTDRRTDRQTDRLVELTVCKETGCEGVDWNQQT